MSACSAWASDRMIAAKNSGLGPLTTRLTKAARNIVDAH